MLTLHSTDLHEIGLARSPQVDRFHVVAGHEGGTLVHRQALSYGDAERLASRVAQHLDNGGELDLTHWEAEL